MTKQQLQEAIDCRTCGNRFAKRCSSFDGRHATIALFEKGDRVEYHHQVFEVRAIGHELVSLHFVCGGGFAKIVPIHDVTVLE